MNFGEELDHVRRLHAACAELSEPDKLQVFASLWLYTASNVRGNSLALPDGYPIERARQVAALREMAGNIEKEEPDIELERLALEGDRKGIIEHMKEQIRRPKP